MKVSVHSTCMCKHIICTLIYYVNVHKQIPTHVCDLNIPSYFDLFKCRSMCFLLFQASQPMPALSRLSGPQPGEANRALPDFAVS